MLNLPITTAVNVMERPISRTIFCCLCALILLTALPASAQFSTNANSGMIGTEFGVAVVADFDNDGLLEVFFNGQTGGGQNSTIWHNAGNGMFSDLADFGGSARSGLGVGDFYNSGRLDAIVTGIGNAPGTEFWHNLDGGTFNFVTNSGLPAVGHGYVAVGDFDNDGLLDIMFWGGGTTSSVVQIYKNLGNGQFVSMNSGIHLIGSSSTVAGVFAADFDNDGYLDVLIGPRLWRNLGNGTFTNIPSGLPGGVTAIGDFDNDGFIDVLLTNVVWRNLGNGTFTNIGAGIVGTGVSVGDYDNDGYLDVLAPFVSGVTSYARVWRNVGGGYFNNTFTVNNPPLAGTMLWGDFNNDGQLDFFITGIGGYDTNGNPLFAAQIWQNTLTTSNSPPTAPTNLTSHLIGGSGVRMNWSAATDDHTPTSGLNYNIRVGATTGGLDIVSPMADPATGRRLVVQIGNAQERLFSILTNLTGGTYYWSVQAIDTAFAGGPFATEATFTIPPTMTSYSYQSNGQFQVNFNALANNSYSLYASTDLTNWTSLASAFPFTAGPASLIDTNTLLYPRRYYRLSCP